MTGHFCYHCRTSNTLADAWTAYRCACGIGWRLVLRATGHLEWRRA